MKSSNLGIQRRQWISQLMEPQSPKRNRRYSWAACLLFLHERDPKLSCLCWPNIKEMLKPKEKQGYRSGFQNHDRDRLISSYLDEPKPCDLPQKRALWWWKTQLGGLSLVKFDVSGYSLTDNVRFFSIDKCLQFDQTRLDFLEIHGE